MSIFSFSENKKEEVSLLIDIGNGSIGGAFLLWREGKIPKILYNTRLPFTIVEDIDYLKLSQGMDNLFEEILDVIMDKGFTADFWKNRRKKLSSILVSFSSPWFVSRTKNIHISEQKPFLISESFLNNILSKEEKILTDELKKNNSDFEIIEKSIVHTKINGYYLTNVVGKKTTVFDLFVCLGVLGQNISNKTRKAISRHINIPKEKILLHTFPLISFSVIRDIFPNINDFIMMDITSEITEITVVRDDVIIETISFAYGKNFIIREIAKTLNIPTEVALSNLHLYSSNKAGESTSTDIENIISKAGEQWLIHLEKALERLSRDIVTPRRIYVTADSDVATVFINFMKSQNLDLVHLNHETLSRLYENNPANMQDEFIGILSIFYDKIKRGIV